MTIYRNERRPERRHEDNHLTVDGFAASSIRWTYRSLRRYGTPAYAARWAVYDLLLTGRWSTVTFHPASKLAEVAS